MKQTQFDSNLQVEHHYVYDVELTTPWASPRVNIYLREGQQFAVNAIGGVLYRAPKDSIISVIPPDGDGSDFINRVEPSLPCMSLIGLIYSGDQSPRSAFSVGSHFTGTATRSGYLVLTVNDGYFKDNVGKLTATVDVFAMGDKTVDHCKCDQFPQPGDVPNMIFIKQERPAWCWAATAQMLMIQATNTNNPDYFQCQQAARFLRHKGLDCCQPKACNSGFDIKPVLFWNTFSYSNAQSLLLNESDIVRQISYNKRPIAVQIEFSGTSVNHYEIIYGYYYQNNQLHVRIWDPYVSDIIQNKRCELYETYPLPINGSKVKIVRMIYNVQHNDSKLWWFIPFSI